MKTKKITLSVFLERKKSLFENWDSKNITDNKSFSKTVKHFSANKISSNLNKLTLSKKDEIISRGKDVTKIFNTSFVNVASTLSIVINESLLVN